MLMSCRLDVKEAIIDSVMKRFVDGRYTFKRISSDTIEITNQGRAKTLSQAQAIGRSLLQRISDYYDKHVMGSMAQMSIYDPITLSFQVSPAYIEHEYQKLPADKKTDPADNVSKADPIEPADLPPVTPECK